MLFVPTALQFFGYVFLPCKSLCEEVRADCERKIRELGISWPDQYNCENFPARKGEKSAGKGEMCLQENSPTTTVRTTVVTPAGIENTTPYSRKFNLSQSFYLNSSPFKSLEIFTCDFAKGKKNSCPDRKNGCARPHGL